MYLTRGLERQVVSQLASRPVVILEGARGVGKTSLASHLLDAKILQGRFFSFADEAIRALAESSPKAFVDELPFGSVVDEAQVVPEIQMQLKQLVDADSAPGRVLLTGSSRIVKNQLDGSAPLAGRSTTLRLEPFTRSERAGHPVSVLAALFDGDPTEFRLTHQTQAEILAEALGGGFPLLTTRSDRKSFIDDALPESLLGRRSRAAVLETGRQLAARTAKPYVADQLTRDLQLDKRTLGDYVDIWEHLMLIRRLQNWRPSPSSSVRAQRKLHVVDIGLATAWGDLDPDRDRGPLFETLVANELIGQSWSEPDLRVFHYREDSTHEVDLVLCRAGSEALVGIEVKAASEVGPRDFKQLLNFRNRSKGRMLHGYVFYSGDRVLPYDEGLWAVPIAALWGSSANQESGQASLSKAAATLTSALRQSGNPSLLANRSPAVERRVTTAMKNFTNTLADAIAELGLEISFTENRAGAASMPAALPYASAASARFTGDTSHQQIVVTLEAAPVGGDKISYLIWVGRQRFGGAQWATIEQVDAEVDDPTVTDDTLLAAVVALMPALTETLRDL